MASSFSQGSQKYDVFLKFRGQDVRLNFLSHLILAFNHASLNFFVDYKLERGEQIKSALTEAMQDSKVALTIFSKGYASSEWSLDELVKIMECRENPTLKQTVIPVFYRVTPSDVRNVQKGVFAQDFAKHESDHRSRSKVPRWKAAMEAAGYLSGRIVNETSSEAHVLIQIVDDVLTNLGRNYPIWNPGDKMLFHASLHAELHVFFHSPKGNSRKDCPNVQQQSIWTISGPQGLHVQEDLDKVLMSIGGQPSESHSGQKSETSNSHPSSPISYHHGVNSGGLGENNTNGCGLGGTTVPSSSVSMSNGNCGYCLDLENGQWGYGYPVDYGNGYCDYHVDLGNGNWSYYVDRGNGNLYPYEWDGVEQAEQGEGAVTKLRHLDGVD